MKVAIIPNYKRVQTVTCVKEIVSILEKHLCSTIVIENIFNKRGRFQLQPESIPNGIDLLIAVGGDGTIVHSAKIAAMLQIPILGVNAGNLGFIAGLEQDELHLLSNIPERLYKLEKRMLLSISLEQDGDLTNFYALNDAVISGKLSHIMDYDIFVDKKKLYSSRADGLIIATPTGSTAYSLSAGGPVVEPTMNCMVYTPICPHSLFHRSIVFGVQNAITIKVGENTSKVRMTIDGEAPHILSNGDRITFIRAPISAQFIQLRDYNFYDALNQKLIGKK